MYIIFLKLFLPTFLWYSRQLMNHCSWSLKRSLSFTDTMRKDCSTSAMLSSLSCPSLWWYVELSVWTELNVALSWFVLSSQPTLITSTGHCHHVFPEILPEQLFNGIPPQDYNVSILLPWLVTLIVWTANAIYSHLVIPTSDNGIGYSKTLSVQGCFLTCS